MGYDQDSAKTRTQNPEKGCKGFEVQCCPTSLYNLMGAVKMSSINNNS